jgi:hypothetical protein
MVTQQSTGEPSAAVPVAPHFYTTNSIYATCSHLRSCSHPGCAVHLLSLSSQTELNFLKTLCTLHALCHMAPCSCTLHLDGYYKQEETRV